MCTAREYYSSLLRGRLGAAAAAPLPIVENKPPPPSGTSVSAAAATPFPIEENTPPPSGSTCVSVVAAAPLPAAETQAGAQEEVEISLSSCNGPEEPSLSSSLSSSSSSPSVGSASSGAGFQERGECSLNSNGSSNERARVVSDFGNFCQGCDRGSRRGVATSRLQQPPARGGGRKQMQLQKLARLEALDRAWDWEYPNEAEERFEWPWENLTEEQVALGKLEFNKFIVLLSVLSQIGLKPENAISLE